MSSADGKIICSTCKAESAGAHLLSSKSICESNEDCNSWYSTEHHLLFCKERVKTFKLFVPKIDNNLLSRFGDLFELDEKYSMLPSSPTAREYVNLPKIKILQNFSNNDIYYSDTVVVNNILSISKANNEDFQKLMDSISSKRVICVPRKIKIKNSKNISAQNVLGLLSKYTKEFKFKNSSCTPTNLNFTDIIKKAPNIEVFDNYDEKTNIEIDKTWVEDLMKYAKSKKIQKLHFKFGVFEEFNTELLKQLIRTKCAKYVSMKIEYNRELARQRSNDIMLDELAEKLYEHMGDKQKDYLDRNNGKMIIWIGFDLISYRRRVITLIWKIVSINVNIIRTNKYLIVIISFLDF